MLELDHLTRRYGDVTALDDVAFTVSPGEIVGFVGRNGAGKTTAMRIALGLVEPDAGEIRWKGAEPDQQVRATAFGYMPEERGLYPKMRIVDQLRFLARVSGLGPREAVAAADRWLDRLGLADRSGDQLDTLSLGNQQQVDRGAAVLFSSHQLELVERLCDSVAVIDAGRLVAHGSTDDLRAARTGRRYEVAVRGAIDPRWVEGLAGVRVVSRDGDHLVVELDEQVDDQRLLDAARSAGSVASFGPVRASLADLYREVVPA